MADAGIWSGAVERLLQIQVKLKAGGIDTPLEPSITKQDEVLARFQPLFAPAHLPYLTEAEFRSFLPFRSNQHWSGLQRLGPRMCADMDALRSALIVLLDEGRPIAERYDYALRHVTGLGRAVATAILLVAYPDKYGVWNTTSEAGLKALDLWPRFDRGTSEGERYAEINDILDRLAHDLGVDLWTLDALWHYLLVDLGAPEPPLIDDEEADTGEALDTLLGAARSAGPAAAATADHQLFGLERHLHEFLRDNWDRTELGRDWQLHREPGNDWAGYEYPCKVGRIDLLARHRREPKWLIVELKRGGLPTSRRCPVCLAGN